jgi:hypothetical protein
MGSEAMKTDFIKLYETIRDEPQTKRYIRARLGWSTQKMHRTMNSAEYHGLVKCETRETLFNTVIFVWRWTGPAMRSD